MSCADSHIHLSGRPVWAQLEHHPYVAPVAQLGEWIARARQRRALAALDGRLLRDIGAGRACVRREIAKPFWRR